MMTDRPGAAGAPQPLHERLADHGDGPDLRDRAPVLTREVVDAIAREVPSFAHAGVEFRAVVEVVVGRIVELLLTLFAEVRPASRQEVRELVEACVPPTDQGITLEDMLTVFAVAQRTLWSELHRVLASDPTVPAALVLDLSQVGVTALGELSRGVTSAYLSGDRVWLQRRDAERVLLHALLAPEGRPEEATRAANALDLRVFGSWRCAAYRPGDDLSLDRLAGALRDARATWGVRGAVAVLGEVVVVATQDDDPLPPPEGARVGVGPVGDGTAGIRSSHRDALEALDVAERIGAASLTAEEARLGRIVLGTLSPTAVADAVLAPIDAQPEGRRELLLETLRAWLDAQGSATAAARALGLHVQSTRYRVAQLREVVGEALDDPDQRLLLQLALTARQLAGADHGGRAQA